jgi:hypothetical protein
VQRTAIRPLAGLVLIIDIGLVLVSLVLAMHFEATPRALADAAKGQAVGVPAGAAAVACTAALVAGRRAWGRVALAVGVALTVVAGFLFAVK